VGLAGLVGLVIWIFGARLINATHPEFDLGGKWYSFGAVAVSGIPMVLWSVFVDKVHRNPTTGIDWDAPAKPWRETIGLSLTKLAGLWTTWIALMAIYWFVRFYHNGNYQFALDVFRYGALPLFILSVPYVIWVDTRLTEPRDGAWALGSWLMGEQKADWDAINAHLRAWSVKGFFCAFMISILPGGYHNVITQPWNAVVTNIVPCTNWLIDFMFVIDVYLATTGYVLTCKPLDAHIRSATPYTAGWVSALLCYPPVALYMIDYKVATLDWFYWLDPIAPEHAWGSAGSFAFWAQVVTRDGLAALLVMLTAIYAWATMAFGIRFSNLTDRGIMTHGPYAWTKHPAYLSKNLFWWLVALPFLVTSHSWTDAIRNCAMLLCVNGIYYWRARTEEWHLRNDPTYVAYEAWMAEYGVITSRLRRLLGF